MSAFAAALNTAGIMVRANTPVPAKLLEPILNQRRIDRQRMDMRGSEYLLHVSGLIKSSNQDLFCPREHILSHFEKREKVLKSLTPGMELLYEMGHTIHDLVRNKFIFSPLGDAAWGNWCCPCKLMELHGCLRPDPKIRANVCSRCHHPATVYKEYSLFLHKYRLVGHPDFIIKWGSVFYLVEIKTIDRADVDFDTLDGPLGDHTLQASFYYWMMRDLGFNVSARIIYLYVDRSNTKLWRGWPYKELHAMRSKPDRISPFLLRAEAVIDGISSKTLPPRLRVCASDLSTRAKNCACAVSCFSRKSNRIEHSGLAGAPATTAFDRPRPVAELHGAGLIRPDDRPLAPPKIPFGRKTRVDPLQHDIGGRRIVRREPATPIRDVLVPGGLQFRQPPTTR